jgi:putative hydrolase of the HAD superfamily
VTTLDGSTSGSTPLRAVVLDFGGVFTASPFEVARAVGAAAGMEASAAIELLFGPYDHDTDHPWHRAERGELTITACRDEILALSTADGGASLDLWDVFRMMGERVSGVRDVVVEHTRRLRAAGLRTGLLTNNILEARDFWRPLLPLDELFDDVVDSCEVGLRKPDERIYRLALERLGVDDPAEAVFLDDWPGNVEAARRFGMAGIVVGDDPAPAFAELERLVGLDPV